MKRNILLALIIISVTLLFSCSNKKDNKDPEITFKLDDASPIGTPLPYYDNDISLTPENVIRVISKNINPDDNVFEYSSTSVFFDNEGQQHGYNYTEDRANWFDEIEKRFGIKLKITSLFDAYMTGKLFSFSYHNEVDATIKKLIENGTITGLFKVGAYEYVGSLANEGLILPLDQYLQDNENWQSLPEDYRNAFKVNGLTYGIPQSEGFTSHTRYIRQDWLDKFNLEQPETIPGFYEVMKAFTYNDPDGDGENNTSGFIHMGFMGLEDIFNSFDVRLNPFGKMLPTWNPNTNLWEDGMLKPEMEECLDFLRICWNETLLVTDHSVWMESLFNTGYSGSFCTYVRNLDITDTVEYDKDKGERPRLSFITAMTHLAEENINGYFTRYSNPIVLTKNSDFPTTTINTLINVFMADFDGYTMGRYGLEGSGYTLTNDAIIIKTWEFEDERYAYFGPKIMFANPLSSNYSRFKISDYDYNSGNIQEVREFGEAIVRREEMLTASTLCYKIPWEVVFPEYPTSVQSNLPHMEDVTSFIFRKVINGAFSYEDALNEYRKEAKKSNMQEFLDQQNSRLKAKSWQSY